MSEVVDDGLGDGCPFRVRVTAGAGDCYSVGADGRREATALKAALEGSEGIEDVEVVQSNHVQHTDKGEIEDIAAVEDCASCGWSPAAAVLLDGEWKCYGCGRDPDGE